MFLTDSNLISEVVFPLQYGVSPGIYYRLITVIPFASTFAKLAGDFDLK
jgi:hypothetical protein